ncbi:SpaA isopeptide-forming pilin-related protein [Galactobacter sp.]|uniref:SpaA isopeptide-forming pilin-related protein n=1 Tax=Galactobacter sp. TaxID=2676125 RepID=UPI0025C34D1F|nr:SpaA isopeptide-forming pilin-related protein [Galactobacter sp.]
MSSSRGRSRPRTALRLGADTTRRSWGRGTAVAALSAALLAGLCAGPAMADQSEPEASPQATQTAEATTDGEVTAETPAAADSSESADGQANSARKATKTSDADAKSASADETDSTEGEASPRAEIGPLAAAKPLQCTAGTVYSVSGSGQLYEVTNGDRTAVGHQATTGSGWNLPVSSFNGVGIGANGSVAYAYERSNNNRTATIYRYDVGTGNWSNTNVSRDLSWTDSFSGQLVAGAVDLKTGEYYFGGFQTTGSGRNSVQTFRIWKYSPTTGAITYVGATQTASGNGIPTSANGDIAFDSNGNLFIVRGSGNTTTVFSITAANLAAANGGAITSSKSGDYRTSTDVNGVAFDASGKAYLGSSTSLSSYNMPNWSGGASAGSLSGSSDLASCSSPATITLQKKLDGKRYLDADQFDLELKDGSTSLGTATTEGTASGVQDQIVGPFPIKAGTTVNFSEAGADDTDLGNYTSSAVCTADGNPLTVNNNQGTSGTATVPASAKAVVCTITNKAKSKSTLSVVKNFTGRVNAGDQVALSAKDTVTNSAVGTPATTTGQADGVQAQKVGPADILTGSGHSYTIQESSVGGLDFSKYDTSYKCIDTAHNNTVLKQGNVTTTGSSRSVELGAIPAAADLKARTVECTFTNAPKTAQLTLVKSVENSHNGDKAAADWNTKLHAKPSSGTTLNFATGETKTVQPGTFTLSEDQLPGYEQKNLTCTGGELKGGKVTVTAGDKVTCTFTNADKAGGVTWSKDDGHGTLLGDSEWTLTGPGGTSTTIKDCTGAPCAAGGDQDPAKGKFTLTGLDWGDYTLTESKAPAGYVLDSTEHEFTIEGAHLVKAFDTSFKNDQAESPTLPLTGGTGTDAFLIAGGLILVAGAGTGAVLTLRRRKGRNG